MVLSIDIGNTLTKFALIEKGRIEAYGSADKDHLQQVLAHVRQKYEDKVQKIGWINVNQVLELQDYLGDWEVFCQLIDSTTDFPIKNAYKTPDTLGTDRIVAVIGAQTRISDGAVLVIDAGTAITYDYADEYGTYHGGGIGPGMNMRFKALHEFTARLPLLEAEEIAPLVGQSTQESILSGVVNGMAAEIDGIINNYKSIQKGKLTVFLTGGDASFFEKRLKNINFASSNLIHLGIYHILTHQ
ncbi:MAG: type III pantothenate kinase [Bacteroidia bacterium]|nr:type III pantothenate kinase [Bacteroidia bacterium]